LAHSASGRNKFGIGGLRPSVWARRNSFGASGTAIVPRLSRGPGKRGDKAKSENRRRAYRSNEQEEELPAASPEREIFGENHKLTLVA
jgi:hypothetical protein